MFSHYHQNLVGDLPLADLNIVYCNVGHFSNIFSSTSFFFLEIFTDLYFNKDCKCSGGVL